jgi:AraC-like DNA-binding protein
MAVKKINLNSDEMDISELLKKWWSFRKFVIFGTLIIGLIATFILILANEAYLNKKQNFVTAVIKSDLGDQSSLILSSYKSQPYIIETLKRLSLDIDVNEVSKNLIIKESTDPLTENLKNQILSTDEKKLKSLALSNEELSKIIQNLNDNSKELITIQLYHEPLNISAEQAENLILSLSDTINKNLLLRSSRESNKITLIRTDDININYLNENEQIARLSAIINSAQRNISIMNTEYNILLKNYDLENLATLANISQKLLHEISKKVGTSISIDTLNIDINQKERDIADLKSSLEYLDTQIIEPIGSTSQNNSSNEVSRSTTQLDAEVFDKILSIGSVLNLNSFRLSTVEKIQQLQQEKSELINQKELLNLPFQYDFETDNLDLVSKRIIFLAEEVNKVNSQILDMTEPKSAFEIIKNPELIKLNSKEITEYIKIILILTILSFFIISFISILIPAKKS